MGTDQVRIIGEFEVLEHAMESLSSYFGQTASTWVDTLDKIVNTYEEIGEFLPSLSEYQQLLSTCPNLKIYLERYYCDVLEFHRMALAVFSRPRKTPILMTYTMEWALFEWTIDQICNKVDRMVTSSEMKRPALISASP